MEKGGGLTWRELRLLVGDCDILQLLKFFLSGISGVLVRLSTTVGFVLDTNVSKFRLIYK